MKSAIKGFLSAIGLAPSAQANRLAQETRDLAARVAQLEERLAQARADADTWKRRQTGFVITHAGLLIVLVGSWISLKFGDEGQVAMLEGDTTATMTRTDAPVIRVRPLDHETGKPTTEYALPFRPGALALPVEQPIAAVYLANGHWLVTSMSHNRAVEFDRAGKEVWEYRRNSRVTRAVRP